ncbi:hypothetical protein BGW38_000926 [Lunasporangiospora selenospora]|uniref:Uncharacterized protein n=1 Tax=Lunasporangiospora selenospora TaxID=979761 RepID=A0A9P6KEG4_9FUNG|nr:hypothetical protein BGW38_000926 [Lunasporangiospora selenospora]
MDKFKEKLAGIRAEADAANAKVEELEAEAKILKAETSAKDQESISLNHRISVLEGQLEKAESGGSDSKSKVRELELKVEDLERRLKQTELERDSLEDKYEKSAEETKKAKADLEETLRAMDDILIETASLGHGPQVHFPSDCDSLLEKCVHIMHTIDPVEKADLTLLLGEQWRESIQARKDPTKKAIEIGRATPPDIPLRPDTLEFVRPGYGVKVGRAGSLSSRIAILHALANVEQWAIDTALDNMARFGYYTQAMAGTLHTGEIENEQDQEFVMPNRFFDDFVQMACDESKHFKWLNDRLEDQGAHYGDLPVHASIWDSCTDTSKSALARMAVVHMTIESRGLDVNPATIARFERSEDPDSAKMLKKIHEDEVTHVQIGHRWFCYLLKRHEGVGSPGDNGQGTAFGASGSNAEGNLGDDGLAPEIDEDELYEFRQVTPAYVTEAGSEAKEEVVDPAEAQRRKRFQEVVVQYFKGSLKPPFNTVDREKGGLSRGWYEPLVVVRERTGFKPASGRRALTRTEKAEIAAKAAAAATVATEHAVHAPQATKESVEETRPEGA